MDGSRIHFYVYAERDSNAEPKRFVITPTVDPEYCWEDGWRTGQKLWKDAAKRLRYFQVNGNVALVQYDSQLETTENLEAKFELWYLTHPTVQLKLPNCESLLTKEESLMTPVSKYLDWLLDTNSNSQYLVRRCVSDYTTMFVLVFHGFTSSKYCHRITMPRTLILNGFVGDDEIHLRTVGSGKDAKTVLTAQSSQYQFYIYDLSTGDMVLKIPLSRSYINYQSMTYDFGCCPYLFPTETLMEEDHIRGGVDVMRIDCTGEKLTISTTFAAYPHLEEYNSIKLIKVTDTQTVWKVDDEGPRGREYCIICDYLLNDLDMANTRKFQKKII